MLNLPYKSLLQFKLAESKAQSACLLIPNPNQDGSILTIAKNMNDFGLPGGKIITGEAPHQTAIRETLEETGILADERSLIPLYCDLAKTMICFTYYCNKIVGGKLLQNTHEGTPTWLHPYHLIKDNCTYKTYNLQLLKILLSTHLM